MNYIELLLTLLSIFMVAIFILYTYRRQTQLPEQQPIIIVNQQADQPEQPEGPLPYWTQYGLPDYWPTYLSPYWYFDVPYYGPITGSGAYSTNYRPWSGGRGNYMPHGWGPGPIGGHSGVAIGGGGGGGGHGGR